ncbi:M28 family peptidase [Sulfidibacter corallicola]|uniref:M28 family peptidase n=1 Tax=Sulfidibacter corallicola TaxID=2818388 RepID=A0A8A4TEQ9_SULCO|nr:M28 family peptidase [Sulfidibacter corallicola]QTD47704.1 M28 family peptidase [Sulfidibacter corallicola]
MPLCTFLLLSLLGLESDQVARELQAHIRFLADDLLEGRETSYRGQRLAARYLETQLELAGLQPVDGASDHGYLQPFDVRVAEAENESHRARFRGGGRGTSWAHGRDYQVIPYGVGRYDRVAPMLYLGYGIKAGDYNDWAGMEAKDHWVVVHDGLPENPSKDGPFSSKEAQRFSNFIKFYNAHGAEAAGLIILKKRNPDKPLSYLPALRDMELVETNEFETKLFPILWVYEDKWPELFGRSYERFQEAHDQIVTKERPRSMEIRGRKLALKLNIQNRVRQTENVVGCVPGTDPQLRDEALVISGHYDHLGVIHGEVFNGADDNGSGTATLLLLARHFAKNPTRRSLIFAFFTGEEQGLLGSDWFVANTPIPLERIVANINVDMIGRNATDTIGVIPSAGKSVSTMNEVLDAVNLKQSQAWSFDRSLDKYHNRSDQYHFAKNGIPTLFFFSDVHPHYHSPADDWERLDYDKLARFYTLMRDFLTEVGDREERPKFLETEAVPDP